MLKSIAAALSRCLRRLKMARTGYSGDNPCFQKITFVSLGGLDSVNVFLFLHMPRRESDKSQNQIWLWGGCTLLFCSTLPVAITARLVVQFNHIFRGIDRHVYWGKLTPSINYWQYCSTSITMNRLQQVFWQICKGKPPTGEWKYWCGSTKVVHTRFSWCWLHAIRKLAAWKSMQRKPQTLQILKTGHWPLGFEALDIKCRLTYLQTDRYVPSNLSFRSPPV